MKRIDDNGFTLVELLVTIALFSVVAVGIYQVVLTTVRSGDVTEDLVRVSEEARAGFNRMIRDAREARALTVSNPNEFRVQTDFNDDTSIDNPNPEGDYEDLIFRV